MSTEAPPGRRPWGSLSDGLPSGARVALALRSGVSAAFLAPVASVLAPVVPSLDAASHDCRGADRRGGSCDGRADYARASYAPSC